MKNYMKIAWGFVLMLVSAVIGDVGGVQSAMAASLPDAGKSGDGAAAGNIDGTTGEGVEANNIPGSPDGIQTETFGRSNGDPDLYLNDVDKRIVRIRPMATPIDQISRYAKAQPSQSFVCKYYSVGTRPIKTSLSANVAAMTTSSGSSEVLPVEDPSIFTLDDTIRVVGVKAKYDYKGNAYDQNDPKTPDLVLCVCGRDVNTGNPVVYAVNGNKKDGQNILVPALSKDTVIIRMGKACGELDVQTGRFNNIPTPEEQYCQNFMIQIEQSTFDKIAAKEVNWDFSDTEEDGIYDMRLAQENTYMWGSKNVIKHVSKDGMATWFTNGIWWMAGKDIEVGTYSSSTQSTEITDEDLVDISKDLFVGTGIGNKRKVVFAGSEMLAAFSKIKSDKFRLKDTVEVWHLKFKSWDTDFGEILMMHDEHFDICGMSDCGFALDPEYLTKRVHVSWGRNVLDLKKAGIRNTNAVVIQEVSCIYLRYAKAHARLKLASA